MNTGVWHLHSSASSQWSDWHVLELFFHFWAFVVQFVIDDILNQWSLSKNVLLCIISVSWYRSTSSSWTTACPSCIECSQLAGTTVCCVWSTVVPYTHCVYTVCTWRVCVCVCTICVSWRHNRWNSITNCWNTCIDQCHRPVCKLHYYVVIWVSNVSVSVGLVLVIWRLMWNVYV